MLESWTPQKLRNLSCYWHERIVATAFHLQLFAWVGRSAKTAGAASRHFGGTTPEWKIFLEALTAMKLLRRRGDRYDNSRFAARYLSDQQASFLLPDYDAWNLWESLPDILTTGSRPKVPQPFFTDRVKAERLLRALDNDGRKIAPHLLSRLHLSRARSVLDVGGGLGTLALACCRRFPRLRATILEHPKVAPLTRSAVEKSRMERRVEVVAMDVFKDRWPPGGFDAVLASNILHGQGVRENRALIASAYKCLNTGGRLIVRDVLIGADATTSAWGALFSVALLVQTPNGRCYSLDEVRGWLYRAGFSNLRGPFGSSPLFFDPDSLLIAQKN